MRTFTLVFFRASLALCLTLAALLPAQGQTLQRVVEAHVQALGGQEALRGLKTLQMAANAKVLLFINTSASSVIVNGEGVFRKLSMAGLLNVKSVATAQGGFKIIDDGKRQAVDPREAASQFDAADLAGPFIDTETKGFSLEFLGERTLKGGLKTYAIDALRKGREPVRYFIRSDNHLLARVETKTFNSEKSLWEEQFQEYDDYRPVAGVHLPFRIRLGDELTLTVKGYKVNEPVDPSFFK